MIARPEYAASSKELDDNARHFTEKLELALTRATKLSEAVSIGKGMAQEYNEWFHEHLDHTLAEIGRTAALHYQQLLAEGMPEEEVQRIVKEEISRLYREKYYQISLRARIAVKDRGLIINVQKSSVVGKGLETRKRNIARIFEHQFPFGAQKHADRRMLLSESVRLEHNIARRFMKEYGVKLARWTLSHDHEDVDICDMLAEAVDPEVVTYIKAHNVDVEPEGVYFTPKLPYPPHPNCQCTLIPIDEEGPKEQPVMRPPGLLRRLLERLIRKRRKTNA